MYYIQLLVLLYAFHFSGHAFRCLPLAFRIDILLHITDTRLSPISLLHSPNQYVFQWNILKMFIPMYVYSWLHENSYCNTLLIRHFEHTDIVGKVKSLYLPKKIGTYPIISILRSRQTTIFSVMVCSKRRKRNSYESKLLFLLKVFALIFS